MDHSFVTFEYLQGTGGLDFTGTADRAFVLAVAEAVSEEIESLTNRHIHPVAQTRTYDATSAKALLVSDLISVTSLKEDNSKDGTYDTTWGTADYILTPHNADPTSVHGRPYSAIEVSPFSNGTQDEFLPGRKRYEVAGTFGWVSATRSTDATATADIDSTAVSFVAGPGPTGTIEAGHTIVIGAEQMFVEAVSATQNSTGTLTVRRGVNGSTAGSHGSGAAISYHIYPGKVQQAAFIQTARLWNRRNSGFAIEVGSPVTGEFRSFRRVDPDVRMLIATLRKIAI